jgi:hypothetical protein
MALLGRLTAAALLTTALAAPGSAVAAPVPLGGSPLNVIVGDLGQLQAFRVDRADFPGIFFRSTSQIGDAGLFLAFPGGTPTVFGFQPDASGLGGITDYTNAHPEGVTGNGSAASPLTQVTTYDAGSLARIKQTTTYVNGAQQFRVRWDITNLSPDAIHLKALAAADFFFDGSDRGTGVFTLGPPKFIGGTNADTGNSGGFEEVLGSPTGSPAWSHYEALEWGDAANQVWGKINAAAGSTNATLADTVVGEPVDNAGAVEWDQYVTGAGIPASATRSFELVVRSAVPAALLLSPSNAGSPRGVPINITATATNTDGVPYAGKTLRYQITGVNPGSGAATLGPAGTAVITDPGTKAGGDTIVAFVDFNDNGEREELEPQASALATFVDNLAPTCTVKVTGDRPGGGGAGKPLVVVANCGEGATVTVGATLTLPAIPKASASARRKRARKIKLRKVTHVVTAGKRATFKLRLPKKIARRYAGRKLKLLVTVTAKDPSGNVRRVKKRKAIRVRQRPHRRAHR